MDRTRRRLLAEWMPLIIGLAAMGMAIGLCWLALGCAAMPRGGVVKLAQDATAGDIDTGAKSARQSTSIEKPKTEQLTVSTTYGSLDQNVARLVIVSGLMFWGCLCFAAAAPGPADYSVRMGLYLAAIGFAVAGVWAAVAFFRIA